MTDRLDRDCIALANQCQAATPARFKQELLALTDLCDQVRIDAADRRITLEEYPMPPGWNHDTGAIMYQLPPTYARDQPKAYFPAKMRYRGERPHIMLRCKLDGWNRHCIHDFSDRWRPDHTLVTMTKMVTQSLRHPNKRDPWVDYDR